MNTFFIISPRRGHKHCTCPWESTILQLLRSRGHKQLPESSRSHYFTHYHNITTVPMGTLSHKSHGGTAKLQVQFCKPSLAQRAATSPAGQPRRPNTTGALPGGSSHTDQSPAFLKCTSSCTNNLLVNCKGSTAGFCWHIQTRE